MEHEQRERAPNGIPCIGIIVWIALLSKYVKNKLPKLHHTTHIYPLKFKLSLKAAMDVKHFQNTFHFTITLQLKKNNNIKLFEYLSLFIVISYRFHIRGNNSPPIKTYINILFKCQTSYAHNRKQRDRLYKMHHNLDYFTHFTYISCSL